MTVIGPYIIGLFIRQKTPSDIKKFGVYTEDHQKLIKWLQQKQVKHIAMESTGSYWQTLFRALQQGGFTVVLVDGK